MGTIKLLYTRIRTWWFYTIRKKGSISGVCPIELFNYKCGVLREADIFKHTEIKSLKHRHTRNFHKVRQLKKELQELNVKYIQLKENR